ncbi:MAG: hypothetical protein L0K86_28685 [Actinomycetia bacterium]|nr:hypothetical protein [Actinomycetes bacterium]
MQFYPRSEWPSSTGIAPDGVDGWETGTVAFAEWERHLDRVLPELAVHDLAQQLADVEERLRAAAQAARFAGLSWSRIAAVAGTRPVDARRRWELACPAQAGTGRAGSPTNGADSAR